MPLVHDAQRLFPASRWPVTIKLCAICAICIYAAVANAQAIDAAPADEDWQLSGSVNARWDHYAVSGDADIAPYASTGSQYYSDFAATFARRISAYEKMSAQITAAINESAYRGNERGGVVQQLKALWEKGDAAIPFRAEAGDIFAYQSLRTLQRGLRGGQIEWQPETTLGKRQSVLLAAGTSATSYRHNSNAETSNDRFASVGWLLEETPMGTFNLSNTWASRRAGAGASGSTTNSSYPGYSQSVTSLGYLQTINQSWQRLFIQGERALFRGAADGQAGVHDQASMVTVEGRVINLPLNYLARWERIGQGYRPSGAAAPADAEQTTLQASWRFLTGQNIVVRALQSRDGWDSGRETKARTAQATLNGPVIDKLFINTDMAIQQRRALDDSLRDRLANGRVEVSYSFLGGNNIRSGFSGRRAESEVANTVAYSRDWFIQAGLPFDWSGIRGTFSPGITWRNQVDTTGTQKSFSPTLLFTASRDNHSFTFSRATTTLKLSDAIVDASGKQTAFSYTYGARSFRITADGEAISRVSPVDQHAQARRIGFSISIPFDRASARAVGRNASGLDAGAASIAGSGFDIAAMGPNTPLANLEGLAAQFRIAAFASQGDYRVSEAQIFNQITSRQRVVAKINGERVTIAAIVVDPNSGDTSAELQRQYERIQESMLRAYGSPTINSTQGNFSQQLTNDLNAGTFRRVMEWRVGNNVLRFGIPRRLDGQIRFEIQLAAQFNSSVEANRWSLEDFR